MVDIDNDVIMNEKQEEKEENDQNKPKDKKKDHMHIEMIHSKFSNFCNVDLLFK